VGNPHRVEQERYVHREKFKRRKKKNLMRTLAQENHHINTRDSRKKREQRKQKDTMKNSREKCSVFEMLMKANV
jgi:hypothetical protein